MTGALKDHSGTISIVKRTMTNVLFADDIDGIPPGWDMIKV